MQLLEQPIRLTWQPAFGEIRRILLDYYNIQGERPFDVIGRAGLAVLERLYYGDCATYSDVVDTVREQFEPTGGWQTFAPRYWALWAQDAVSILSSRRPADILLG